MKRLTPLILISLLLLTTSCSTLNTMVKKKPQVSLKSISIQSITLKEIEILLNVGIKNPYPFTISLEKVETTALIENHQFFKTATSQGLKIDSEKELPNQFLITIKVKDILSILKDAMTRNDLLCKIDSSFDFALPKMPGLPQTVSIPFSAEVKIPSLKGSLKESLKKKFW